MKKALLMLAAAVLVGAGMAPVDVDAATRKKAVATKKKAPRVAKQIKAKKSYHRNKAAPRRASLDDAQNLALQSGAALVLDQATGTVLFEKNSSAVLPIASITKLMTAMVMLDAHLPMGEEFYITDDDVDTLKGSRSRLAVGTQLTRQEALLLALMSSENRAAHALGRNYPGGIPAFVAAMNRKAQELGMTNSRFLDPTGLNSGNVSTARDLAKMVTAAYKYPAIREASTTSEAKFDVRGRMQEYRNTNPLVRSDSWDIGVTKTGFIREAGKCLVMQAKVNNRPMVFVLLDSEGSMTRVGDANRLKRWAEAQHG